MTAGTLTREQVRQRIDLLEALQGVMGAIDDVAGVEFEPGEDQLLDLQIGVNKQAVAGAHALPPEVVLAGLQAMRGKLESLL